MKKNKKILGTGLVILLVVAMLFSMTAVNLSGAQAAAISGNEKVDVVIGFHGPPNRGLVQAFGGEIYREFTIVDVIAASMTQHNANALARNPQVSYVELDGFVFAEEVTVLSASQTVPWGIERVFGDEEYPFHTWSSSTGKGIGVAVLDTGIDEDHEDLPELAGGINTIDDTHWGSDGSGHGTHVAGTIAALDNDLGVVGVSPKVSLYAVKVLDDSGSGTISSVVAGIEWAGEQNIPVLNMSLGTGTHYQTLQDACDAANSEGHLLISSAGNSGNPPGRGDNVTYPAKYSSVIAVAASGENDKRASFSSTGPEVELIAPGVSILSTLPGDEYGTYSGTSMASPHVAGAAALAWAVNSDLTNAGIREILQDTAEDLGLSSNRQGYGLVRADLAVKAASELEPPATGDIKGTVKDEARAVIEGATVAVEGTSLSAITDADGYYLLENVPAGDQQVTASADGYYSKTATVTVVEDETVTQDFVLEAITTHTITATAGEGGTIDPSGDVVVCEGDSQTFTITPDTGYEISDIVVDGGSVGAVDSYTFEDVTDDHTIHATFDEIATYTVSGTVTDSNEAALEGATVAIEDTDYTAETDAVGYYEIFGVEEGNYDITASKSGYSSQTKPVTVDGDKTVDFTLEKATVATEVCVESIEYSTRGGPNKDRHLDIVVALKDDLGNPVADASVSATLHHNDESSWDFRGTTDSDGTVTFSLLNHGSGDYWTEITAVVAEGLDWDGVTPENSYTK